MRCIECVTPIFAISKCLIYTMLIWLHEKFSKSRYNSKIHLFENFWVVIARKKSSETGTRPRRCVGMGHIRERGYRSTWGIFNFERSFWNWLFFKLGWLFFRISWIFKIIGHFWKNSFHAQNSSFSWICRKNKVYKGNPWRFWNKSAILYQIT